MESGNELELEARTGVFLIPNPANLVSERVTNRAMPTSSNIEEQAKATLGDPRRRLIVPRGASADGKFYYAVATTGVNCRPPCAARLARPENVKYFESRSVAEKLDSALARIERLEEVSSLAR